MANTKQMFNVIVADGGQSLGLSYNAFEMMAGQAVSNVYQAGTLTQEALMEEVLMQAGVWRDMTESAISTLEDEFRLLEDDDSLEEGSLELSNKIRAREDVEILEEIAEWKFDEEELKVLVAEEWDNTFGQEVNTHDLGVD